MFFMTHADLDGLRSASARYQANMRALRLLHDLTAQQRDPQSLTRAEQQTLARYTAFGEAAVLNRVFTDSRADDPYAPPNARGAVVPTADLAAVTSTAEQDSIKRTALTAFYTPPDIVSAIWECMLRLGLGRVECPRILEPAAGTGNFISLMPDAIRTRAEIDAVEIDPVSARIVGMLHPDVRLWLQGFQDVRFPADYFDLVISNVPFSDVGVVDRGMPKEFLTRTLHDYFFAKALRVVRPGGIVAFLTSYGTMDKQDTRVRSWLAQQSRMLGAFRLPQGVFGDVAGTESGTDLIILQRLQEDETERETGWIASDWTDLPRMAERSGGGTTGSRIPHVRGNVRLSQYWTDHPGNVIGRMGRMMKYGSAYLVVEPPDDGTAPVLTERLAMLPGDILPLAQQEAPAITVRTAPDTDLTEAITDERGRRLLEIYQAAKALIDGEVSGAGDGVIAAARQHLNTVYDGFVGLYGVISSPANTRRLKDMPELAFLLSLEEDVQTVGKTVRAQKCALFSQSALRAERTVAGDLAAADALLVCLDRHGRVDLEVIAHLSGRTPGQVIADLGDRIYPVPNTRPQAYETADAYLSGDIRVKLAAAEAMVGIDPTFQRNVDALRGVLPAPIPAQEIMVNLGAAWVPGTDVSAFITSIIPRFNHGVVRYREAVGAWDVAAPPAARRSVEAESTWGTGAIDAISIIEQTLNGRIVKIYDTIQDGERERRVLNDVATMAAQEKQRQIKQRFSAWVWDDPERTERLAAAYNACYNSTRLRQYDGSHLSLAGMNTAILRGGDLSPWQKDAIWQALQSRSTLIGHAVGAGKTFELVAMAREARRMGLARKPMVIVPNHLVEQWAREAQRLYPGMRVLAMSPEDFTKERRGIYLSRVATGDWDLVIVAHTSFTRLPVGVDTMTRFVDQRVGDLRTFLEEVRMEEDDKRAKKRRIKEIERRIAAYELKLKRTEAAIAKDSTRTITWEQLGVDMLMVDEAHEFKNLEIETRMDTVAGVPRGGSLRAWDLWMKSWEIQRRNGKVVFATGTPVANTLAEVFVMMRYLQQDMLEAKGLAFFDAWVQAFAEATPSFEMRPDGSGYRMHTRLNRFINLPELVTLWRQCLNSRTAEQLNLPRPTMVTGSPIPVVIPESTRLKTYVSSLVARVDAIKGGQVPPDVDNMLKVTGDGRKAALDLRQVMDGPEESACKINACVERVAHHYRETREQRGAQLIFCDLATPKGTAPARGETADEETTAETDTAAEQWAQDFVYHEIRDKLVAQGLDRAEIAFIHEHPTRAKRDALFAAVRTGRVRVLLGSTSKMGTGMNVQDRLIALHHLDAPWRPCDVEQRDGRMLRQGNRFGAVFIYHYIQQGSFDGYIWQLLENKARFISQVLAEDVTQRCADDIAEVVLTAGEMKALASGNPRVVEKVKLETELGRLQRLKAAWQQNQRMLDWDCRGLETRISDLTDLRARLQGAQATRDRHGEFAITVVDPATKEQTRYTGWAEAGSAINQAVGTWLTNQTLRRGEAFRQVIGTVQGLVIQAVLPAWRQDDDPPELAIVWVNGDEWTRIGTATIGKDKGTTQSIAAVVRGIEEQIRRAEQRRAESRTDLAGRREEQAKPWDGAATLQKVIAELRRLDGELGEDRPADADTTGETTEDAAAERVDVAALLSEAAAMTATPPEETAPPEAAPEVVAPPAETPVEPLAEPEALVRAGTVDDQPAQEIERREPDLADWYAQCGISSVAPTDAKRRQREVDATTVLDAAENDANPWREVPVKKRRTKGKKDDKKVVQYSFLEG